MLVVVGRGRSAFVIQVRSSTDSKIYKYNNNLPPLPLPHSLPPSLPPSLASSLLVLIQSMLPARRRRERKAKTVRQRETERERWGGNSCKRIPNINKLHEASVKKKEEDREGVPVRVFCQEQEAWSSQEYPTSGEAMR